MRKILYIIAVFIGILINTFFDARCVELDKVIFFNRIPQKHETTILGSLLQTESNKDALTTFIKNIVRDGTFSPKNDSFTGFVDCFCRIIDITEFNADEKSNFILNILFNTEENTDSFSSALDKEKINAEQSQIATEELDNKQKVLHVNRKIKYYEKVLLDSLLKTNVTDAWSIFTKCINSSSKESDFSDDYLNAYVGLFNRVAKVFNITGIEKKNLFFKILFYNKQSNNGQNKRKRRSRSTTGTDQTKCKRSRKNTEIGSENSTKLNKIPEATTSVIKINQLVVNNLTNEFKKKNPDKSISNNMSVLIEMIAALNEKLLYNGFTIRNLVTMMTKYPAQFKLLGKKNTVIRSTDNISRSLLDKLVGHSLLQKDTRTKPYLYSVQKKQQEVSKISGDNQNNSIHDYPSGATNRANHTKRYDFINHTPDGSGNIIRTNSSRSDESDKETHLDSEYIPDYWVDVVAITEKKPSVYMIVVC